jgi:hypothetical protein
VLLLAPLISDCTNFTTCSKQERQKDRVVVTLKVKAADTLLTPFVRLLRNGHLSQSEISQRIQRKYTTTSVKGQRKEGRRKKTFITKSTYNNFRQQKSETGVQKL